MIVRVVTYGATSREAVDGWLAEREGEIREVGGLERVEFIRRDRPLRAGAIMYFESPAALRQYRRSRRYERLTESIETSWLEEDAPVRDRVFRVM